MNKLLWAALLSASIGGYASAQTADPSAAEHVLGEHPAILVKRQPLGVDTNRLILMHPAQLMVVDTPTPTYDHPAIAARRLAKDEAVLDRYMAEPPVAAAWLRRAPITASIQTTVGH